MATSSRYCGLLTLCLFALCNDLAAAVPATTDLRAQFFALESRLFQAVKDKSHTGLEAILAPTYTLGGTRSGTTIATVSRALYIRNSIGPYKIASFKVDDLTAQRYGEAVLVRLIYEEKASFQGRDAGGRFLLVDLWDNPHHWQLVSRTSQQLK